MNNILDYETTKIWLKHITELPPEEHGGFHEHTINIAKSALYHLQKLFETNNKMIRALIKVLHRHPVYSPCPEDDKEIKELIEKATGKTIEELLEELLENEN